MSFPVAVLAAAAAFVVMEPVTWAAHRLVMHGRGWRLHRGHHQPTDGWFEANDVYPAVFAVVVMGALWVGFHAVSQRWLVPVAVGVTLYGAAYALVHDGAVHGRLPVHRLLPDGRRPAWLQRLVSAHLVHHRTGGEPFGMLLPYVPVGERDALAAHRRAAIADPTTPLRRQS